MTEKKVTWNDLHEATSHELRKTYRLDERQLEQAVRKHWDGANHTEQRALYEKVYSKRR
jgi:hypothetical protein